MKSLQQNIDLTYGCGGLAARLLGNLESMGTDITQLTTRDLLAFDELHVMGRQATLALGQLAGLLPGMRVLDIGSGLGGPARSLARGFGCHVTGVDLSAEFVKAATELSGRVGMAQEVVFHHADALALPFEDNGFDAAFMIHLNMNVSDKNGLLYEAKRVIKPGAFLMVWEICLGPNGPPKYPVPWADNEKFSHLITIPDMMDLMRAEGFADFRFEDATEDAVAWVKDRLAAMKKLQARKAQPDLDLVLKNFRLKRSNVSKNLLTDAIRILRARCTK